MHPSHLKSIIEKLASLSVYPLAYKTSVRSNYWRVQKKVSPKTIDTEFEELVEELDAIDDACYEMLQLNKVFCSFFYELISSSQRVVNSFHILIRSGASNLINDTDSNSGNWERAQSYQVALEDTNMIIRETLVSIPVQLDSRIRCLISKLDQIHTHISKRDKLLTNYEKLLDEFDAMTILGATNSFSPKQKLAYLALEKALDEAKSAYIKCNAMICLELPYFFMLVRKFMEPALGLLYFIHLTSAYQTHLNFSFLQADKDIGSSSFLKGIVKNFQLPDSDILDNLRIVRYHRDYLELLIRSETSTLSGRRSNEVLHCRALYDYKSDVEEDLQFKKGDIIEVFRKRGDWWSGQCNGKRGIFPVNHVEPYYTFNKGNATLMEAVPPNNPAKIIELS